MRQLHAPDPFWVGAAGLQDYTHTHTHTRLMHVCPLCCLDYVVTCTCFTFICTRTIDLGQDNLYNPRASLVKFSWFTYKDGEIYIHAWPRRQFTLAQHDVCCVQGRPVPAVIKQWMFT